MAAVDGSSASSFYNQLRKGYLHTDNLMQAPGAAGAQPHDAQSVHTRLRAITAGEKVPQQPPANNINVNNSRTVSISPMQSEMPSAMKSSSPHQPAIKFNQQQSGHPFQNYQAPSVHGQDGPNRQVVHTQDIPNLAVNNDTALTEDEMSAIRVFEFDARVRVSADVRKPHDLEAANIVGSPSKLKLQSLCDDAIAKVFPKHVVFVRSDGSPVVEIVINELFELTEDDLRQSLTFHLQQQKGGIAVIEVVCANSAVRSALYKTIVAKRNALERFA